MSWTSVIITMLLACGAVFGIYKIFKKRRARKTKKILRIEDIRCPQHQWEQSTRTGLLYCNICLSLIQGLLQPTPKECKVCGIIAHKFCTPVCKLPCKVISSPQLHTHQLIHGNVPVNSKCSVCELICGSIYNVEGCMCIWCQQYFHDDCLKKAGNKCDLGSLKKYIISPEEITILKNQDKGDMLQDCIEITVKDPNKIPIVIVMNKISGGKAGNILLNQYNKLLNPIQVVNLIDEGVEKLKLFRNVKNLRVIVGGGDGTISSITSFLKDNIPEFKQKNPPVAPYALGTGNDLSNSLGWGGSAPNYTPENFIKVVGRVSVPILLDRYEVHIQGGKSNQNWRLFMYNYFGIGLDAKFALDFQNMRDKFPQLFTSQIGNKFIYSQVGTFYLLNGKRFLLDSNLILECDGKVVQFQDCENLIIQNITYWGGGASDIWENDEVYKTNFRKQSVNDKLIEVLSVSSLLHLGQCQIELAKPKRVCQGKNLKIKCKAEKFEVPFHVDGESHMLDSPFEITIDYYDQVYMLAGNEQENLKQWGKVFQTLEWAEGEKHITSQQKDILIKKFNSLV